jgi:hypothetical protein
MRALGLVLLFAACSPSETGQPPEKLLRKPKN